VVASTSLLPAKTGLMHCQRSSLFDCSIGCRKQRRQDNQTECLGRPKIAMSALPPKADIRQCKSNVRFGSKADICAATSHVRFTPNSDRESGFPHKVMSALPPKADMWSALAYVCFGPIADMPLHANLSYWIAIRPPVGPALHQCGDGCSFCLNNASSV
jgi:hypothetical protein